MMIIIEIDIKGFVLSKYFQLFGAVAFTPCRQINGKIEVSTVDGVRTERMCNKIAAFSITATQLISFLFI